MLDDPRLNGAGCHRAKVMPRRASGEISLSAVSSMLPHSGAIDARVCKPNIHVTQAIPAAALFSCSAVHNSQALCSAFNAVKPLATSFVHLFQL